MTETYVSKEQFNKDQAEYESVLDDIFDKTDEELQTEKEEAAKKANEDLGKSDKDLSAEADPVKPEEVPATDPVKSDPVTPDTTTGADGVDWKVKAEESEAELKKERQRTASWDGRIKAANDKATALETENEALKKEAEEKATKKEPTKEEQSDQEVMDTFRKTFPELIEVVDILEKKIKTPEPAKAKAEPKVEKEPEPEVEPATSDTEHYKAIAEKHPDIDELVRSGVMITWINTQPEYIQPYLNSVVASGTSDQVIKTVTEFKSKTGWKSSISGATDEKKKKLESMVETNSDSAGPKTEGPDKNDFDGAAKEAGL